MRLKRKSAVALVVVVSMAAIAGLSVGIWYGVTHAVPGVPVPNEPQITAEPTYTVVFSWEKSRNANRYVLEYEYVTTEPGAIYRAETDSLSVSVDRRRGQLRYRLIAENDHESSASEWSNLIVPGLKLNKVAPFNMERTAALEYSLVADSFQPVTYNYRGETYTINYYEVDVLAPGEERDLDPVTLSLEELTSGWKIYASSAGEWKIFIRPVTYVYVNGERVYLDRIAELYSQDTEYTAITVIIN